MMPIERKLNRASTQLNPSHRTIGYDFVGGAGVDQEERESVLLGKRGKLSAGARHPVNLTVGAWKQRHPDLAGNHAITSCGTSDGCSNSAFPLNVKFRACLTEAFSSMRNTEKIRPR